MNGKRRAKLTIQIFLLCIMLIYIFVLLFQERVFLIVQKQLEIPKRPITVGNAEIVPGDNWLFFLETKQDVGIDSKVYGIYPIWLYGDKINHYKTEIFGKAYIFQILIPDDKKEYRIILEEINKKEIIKINKTALNIRQNLGNSKIRLGKLENWEILFYRMEYSEGVFIKIPEIKLSIFLNDETLLKTINLLDHIRVVQ